MKTKHWAWIWLLCCGCQDITDISSSQDDTEVASTEATDNDSSTSTTRMTDSGDVDTAASADPEADHPEMPVKPIPPTTDDTEIDSDSSELWAPDDISDSDDTDPLSDTDDPPDTEESDSAQNDDDDVFIDTDTGPESPTDSDSGIGTDSEASCVPTLIINELDYDQPGVDTAEFIELYNPSDCPMSVEGLAIVLVRSSSNSEYRRIELNSTGLTEVAAGSFLLIAGTDVPIPDGVPSIPIADNSIQNSSSGVALFNIYTGRLLDAICYDTPLLEVSFDFAEGTFSLVQGDLPTVKDSNSVVRSLSRLPDGHRSGNDAADWFATTPTPGLPNTN